MSGRAASDDQLSAEQPADGLFAGLNPAQREAVVHGAGPLLILAGPGSGKTRVITHRIAYLVRHHGIAPWRILAVTFTNKAAREMRDRVEGLLGDTAARDMAVGTFHSRCARILRRSGGAAGVDPRFTIYDDDDQQRLVKQALGDLSIDPKRYSPRAVLSAISRAKTDMVGPAEFARTVEDYYGEIVARVYARYQELLAASHALDFDDLLNKTVELFTNSELVRGEYQRRYDYVLVDEFQDTNAVQYNLAKLLTHPDYGGNGNLCAVGDEDQSIYSWRSARPENFLDLERDYPDVTVIKLEQNYRSTQTILDAAQEVIARGGQRHRKELWTENGDGAEVVVYEAEDAEGESRFIRDEISTLMRRDRRRPRDFAILYRTNAQSRALEESLTTSGIRYRIVGGTRFYERQEVRDLIAYLRVVLNPADAVSLARIVNVPGRKIGDTTIQRLQRLATVTGCTLLDAIRMVAHAAGSGDGDARWLPAPSMLAELARARASLVRFAALMDGLLEAAPGLTPPQLIQEIVDRTGFRAYLRDGFDNGDDRWENVQQLIAAAAQYDEIDPVGALQAFLENVALVSDADDVNEREDAVTLMTLHTAKGLEFPVVFLAGMEEAVLPHIRSYDSPEQMEEERRLCYVGLTRAKEQLYLTHARFRVGFGGGQHNPRSRFLDDIPERLKRQRSAAERGYAGRPGSHQSGAGSAWSYPAPRSGWTETSDAHRQALAPRAASGAGPDRPRPTYAPGDLVRHAKFGDGIVVSCRPSGDDHLVEIAFKGGVGVKKLMLSFAALEKPAAG